MRSTYPKKIHINKRFKIEKYDKNKACTEARRLSNARFETLTINFLHQLNYKEKRAKKILLENCSEDFSRNSVLTKDRVEAVLNLINSLKQQSFSTES